MNLSMVIIFPFSSTAPTLSPSPSKAIPKSACVSMTFSLNFFKFSGTDGSGWWLGKLGSDSANSGIYSILSDLNISGATILVVPLPQS